MKKDLRRTRSLGRQIALVVASATRTGIVLAVLATLAIAAHAQYRATLRGTVSDPSGAVIPGATVTLTDTGTNQVQTATTDQSGIYTFNGLPPDRFSIKAEAQGFQVTNIAEVVLIPDQPNALNIKMQVGGATQQVVVSGSQAPLLDTDTATVSQTISSNQIQHLPSYDRDVFKLAQLAPGVFGDASQGSGGSSNDNPGNQGPGGTGNGQAGIFATENGPQIQARGGQYQTNGITVDGISTVSAVWGGTSIITPSEDSISNVKVVSNSYDAESGRFSGGQIQVTSKSGTNDFHGSLFIKGSRPGLNAYQRWNGTGSNHAGSPSDRGVNRDEDRTNNFGGSLGGPIWKNKVFFFFNAETSPISSSPTAQGWYETPQFLASAAPANSIASKFTTYKGEAPATNGQIPRTCASIGLVEGVQCATLPGGLDVGSPLKIGLGKRDPSYGGSSSNPGIGSGLDGIPDLGYYNTVNPTTTSQTQWNGRLDADVTAKDHVSFAIYWVPVDNTNYNGPVRPANFWHHSQINDAFSVIWNHTFSPTLLNQARANAAGWRWNEVNTNPQAPFGLPQDSIDNIGNLDDGFQYFGAPGPSNLNQWTYDYNDVLTKILGRHNIKVGGDLTRLYYLNNPVYAARPGFGFRNEWDFANDAPYSESGQFDSKTGVPFANRQDNRINIWGFFVQDDFKMRPNLTINAGLRWSYFGGYYSKQNNLDVLEGLNDLANLRIRVGGNLYTPQKTNFGPQIGFAWQPMRSNGKLVLRGGFGINYNQNEIAITANGNGNPPNAVSPSFSCPGPTCSSILYETATSINSIFGYAPNPATITTFGSNNLPTTGPPIFVTGYESNPKTTSNYHYSLDAQYQLPYDIVATVGYQGSQSRHLYTQANYNLIAAYHGQALSPYANFIDLYSNSASGNYNGLITTLSHNFSHHFQLEGQYTWSKAMDQNSGPYSEDFYPWISSAAYGPSDYNVANAFKVFGMWQPVIFSGSHGWLEKVAGGWSISGIFNAHTGFPFNPVYNTNTSNGSLFYGGSGYSQLRPVAVVPGFGRKTSNKNFQQDINPNYGGDATRYFVAPQFPDSVDFPNVSALPQPGIHRNSLTGPGYQDLDATLTKAFGLPKMPILGEDAHFEFRVDTYNLFNQTNIQTSSIDTTIGSVNPDGTTTPNSNFGVAGSGLGSRTVQLQARFSF